jgi:hypothetical protein
MRGREGRRVSGGRAALTTPFSILVLTSALGDHVFPSIRFFGCLFRASLPYLLFFLDDSLGDWIPKLSLPVVLCIRAEPVG